MLPHVAFPRAKDPLIALHAPQSLSMHQYGAIYSLKSPKWCDIIWPMLECQSRPGQDPYIFFRTMKTPIYPFIPFPLQNWLKKKKKNWKKTRSPLRWQLLNLDVKWVPNLLTSHCCWNFPFHITTHFRISLNLPSAPSTNILPPPPNHHLVSLLNPASPRQ